MTVGTQDPSQRIDSDETGSDVADLKTGLAGTNQRLDRFELANERRFDRVDAQLERLITLIQRDELA
jgi:hypothetical protein